MMPTLIQGDALTELRRMPEEQFHLCVTSPPYWGLRTYGVDGQMGLEPTLTEYIDKMVAVFREVRRVLREDAVCVLNMGDAYAHNGTCGGSSPDGPRKPREANAEAQERMNFRVPQGLKPKDLCGVPWHLAFAMQADGWYLRSAFPWVKRSAMPESCTDRATSALEYIFVFAKSGRYYWDAEAVRQPGSPATLEREKYTRVLAEDGPQSVRHDHESFSGGTRNLRNSDLWFQSIEAPLGLVGLDDELVGLNVTSEPSSLKHYAMFPTRLVEPFILAGTSKRGCCPKCGNPWKGMVERGELMADAPGYKPRGNTHRGGDLVKNAMTPAGTRQGAPNHHYLTRNLGWRPGCKCSGLAVIPDQPTRPGDKQAKERPELLLQWGRAMAEWGRMWADLKPRYDAIETATCRVLDPFSGMGTVGVVCLRLGRDFTGIELSPEYVAQARKRLSQVAPLLHEENRQ
jgi:DNA modification methylase